MGHAWPNDQDDGGGCADALLAWHLCWTIALANQCILSLKSLKAFRFWCFLKFTDGQLTKQIIV